MLHVEDMQITIHFKQEFEFFTHFLMVLIDFSPRVNEHGCGT
jgi:hypothetical protein